MSTKMLQRELLYDAEIGKAPSYEKRLVMERVGFGKRVLEVGAHTGSFSWRLTKQGCRVTAVELNPRAAAQAESRAERIIVGDIEDEQVTRQISPPFDCILFMHVLEHMVDPWRVLRQANAWLEIGGSILVLLPNVACWRFRKELFFHGSFNYADTGLLDRTHLRFFTLYSSRELIEGSGYQILDWLPTDVCVPLHRRMSLIPGLKLLAGKWHKWMSRHYPNLCSEILLFEAIPKSSRRTS